MTGTLTLVTPVWFSIPTYIFFTIFPLYIPLSARAHKEFDRIHRSFVWKGKKERKKGHYLVNWGNTNMLEKHGLSVLDLKYLDEH
jgi:hypothetical protein